MTNPAPVIHTGGRWIGPKRVRITSLWDLSDPQFDRFVIFRTPWFGVQLHKWYRPDSDRDLHNHPRWFATYILRGGYIEETRERPSERTWRLGSVHSVHLTDRHKVVHLLRVPTWTLVIVGPSRQRWGFFTRSGFVDADDYARHLDTKNGERT